MSEFEKIIPLSDLPEGVPRGGALSTGEEICLVRVGDAVYAMENRCTHAEFALSDGDMVDDFVIECALHGAQFDVRTGKVLELPATDDLPCYEVKVEDGAVWVKPKR